MGSWDRVRFSCAFSFRIFSCDDRYASITPTKVAQGELRLVPSSRGVAIDFPSGPRDRRSLIVSGSHPNQGASKGVEELSGERLRKDIGHHAFTKNMDKGDGPEFLDLLSEKSDTSRDVFQTFG